MKNKANACKANVWNLLKFWFLINMLSNLVHLCCDDLLPGPSSDDESHIFLSSTSTTQLVCSADK